MVVHRAWQARSREARNSAGDGENMKVPEFNDLVRELPADAREEDELWALAETQKLAGDRRMHNFMLGRRDLAQLLEKVARAEAAPKKTKRKKLSRVQILEQVVCDGHCSCSSSGQWRTAADEVVTLNGYVQQEVEAAILDALERGRGKQRNIVIAGRAVCDSSVSIFYTNGFIEVSV